MTTAPAHMPHRSSLRLVASVLGTAAIAGAIVFAVRHDSGSPTASGTLRGSGVAATEVRHLAAFTAVELAGSNNISIRIGTPQSVSVTADDNLVSHVTTVVRSGRLVVGTTSGSFTTVTPMHVDITAPSLDTLALSGSGNVGAEGVAADTLAITLSGSGNVRATGTADSLDVTVEGSGNTFLQELAAGNVKAVVSGSGTIFVRATKALDASVPGSGAILYSGDPASVTTNVTGSGTVTRG